MHKETQNKIELINKYFKKDNNIIELSLINYEGYNIYIRLDELKSTKTFKLSWFDLDLILDKNIDKYISSEYIPKDKIEAFINNINALENINTNYKSEVQDNCKVKLDVKINTKNKEQISVEFYKYLPEEITYVYNILNFIFQNLPKKLEGFLYEIISSLTGQTTKYEYQKEFDFDLFNDDINSLFDERIIERGSEYYDDKRVLFLEKIEDKYFAVVEGTRDYLVVVKYNDESKRLQLYCSCPCEYFCKHTYSVLKAIRNNETYRFYKISRKNNTKDLLEKILTFDYFLCLGIVDNSLEIVNNNGNVELVPILDDNNNPLWDVIEDTENEDLTHEIENIIKELKNNS